jgi:hypothetical protein
LRPLQIQEEARPDWTRGLLAVLALVLLLAWLDSLEAHGATREELQLTRSALLRARDQAAAIETSPAVRLDVDVLGGFRCQQFHTRREWTEVVAQKCAELGRVLTIARASP